MKNTVKEQKTDQGEVSRRSFLTKLWVGLGVVGFVEFAGVVVTYLRGGKRQDKAGQVDTIVEAGQVDQYALNSVTAFVRDKFYLCRLEDGGFLAVSRKCTHLGCTVPWIDKEKRFVCPCHASAFDIRGEVISPPAPRALDMYPVTIENNVVKVNTNQPVKRSEFRVEQVAYPMKA
jgi:cytochrome b6-f complex iron-sulfur subunit